MSEVEILALRFGETTSLSDTHFPEHLVAADIVTCCCGEATTGAVCAFTLEFTSATPPANTSKRLRKIEAEVVGL